MKSISLLFLPVVLLAQAPASTPTSGFAEQPAAVPAAAPSAVPATPQGPKYTIPTGTRIPLSMLNSVSTKNAREGDRIYLETFFPVMVDGKIVIPPGSYVAGSITSVKRPGKVKGRGDLYVRFDSLTLPNGVTRDFRARIGSLDGRASETLDRDEGRIKGDGNVGDDIRKGADVAMTGASVGTLAGAVSGRPGTGLLAGSMAGIAAGTVMALLTRGPDIVLAKGTTLDMITDRPLEYEDREVPATQNQTIIRQIGSGDGPAPKNTGNTNSRFPL